MVEFMARFVDLIQEKMGNAYTVSLHTEAKNNGSWRIGVRIEENYVRGIHPIPLLPYFKQYKDGGDMDVLADKLIETYWGGKKEEYYKVSWLNDWEQMKDRLTYRLVNQQKNEEWLKDFYHIPFLDLAIVFYVVVNRELPETGGVFETLPVTNNMYKRWNRATEELMEQACNNMRRLLPNKLIDFAGIFVRHYYYEEDIEKMEKIVKSPDALWFATNKNECFGACVILDKAWMKKIADKAGVDLIIVPATVNEVILHPVNEEIGLKELYEMLNEMNQNAVPDEWFLSDSVYRFDRKQCEVVRVDEA